MGASTSRRTICIVGGGVRGLGLLERLLTWAVALGRPAEIYLVDPAEPFQYARHQPDYLLLNIVCGQVSMFPDSKSAPDAPITSGPSLHEWLQGRNLRIDKNGFSVLPRGRPIEYGDFVPRRLMGDYLAWFREHLLQSVSEPVRAHHVRTQAVDIDALGNKRVVALGDGKQIEADYVVVTAGSENTGIPTRSVDSFLEPYPMPEAFARVQPKQTIALAGFGLTAMDALLALTVGRGGQFEASNGDLRYVPSGEEPKIIMFSRSGLPYRARPSLGAPLFYESVAFTSRAIDEMRENEPELDYDADVLPLLLTELRVAYHRARYGIMRGWNEAYERVEELRYFHSRGLLNQRLSELDQADNTFEPSTAYFGSQPSSAMLQNSETYQQWFCGEVGRDFAQATCGVLADAEKAALEICREFRPVIRRAVEFRGLSETSTVRFFNVHAPAMNRIGVGPQKERSAELLALINSGLVTVPMGRGPAAFFNNANRKWRIQSTTLTRPTEVFADWLLSARIDSGTRNMLKSLADHLLSRGVLTRFNARNPLVPGINIDRDHHPIGADGTRDDRIWILGTLCEGPTYYNGFLTAAGKFDRSVHDADCVARTILNVNEGTEHRSGRIAS